MRDRLIKLFMTEVECNKDGHGECEMCKYQYADKECERHVSEILADLFLAEGVIAPPCNVGDYVYYIKGGYYKEPKYCEVSRPCKVVEISLKLQRKSGVVMRGFITDNGTRYSFDSIGKTVFLNREEAEAALEKRRKNEVPEIH